MLPLVLAIRACPPHLPLCYTYSIPKEVPFPPGICEQERQWLERYLVQRAWQFSDGDGLWAEEAAQEARLAMASYLQRVPDAPMSHLVVCVKAAISRHIRRGYSVDTRRYAPERRHHYPVTSLDTPIRDSQRDGHDVFTITSHSTEMLAIARVLFDHLTSLLNDEESLALQLRLAGFSWPEVGELLYPNQRLKLNERGETMTQALERSLQQKAGQIWPPPDEKRRPPRKRLSSSNYHPLEEIPEALLPHLTDQEREALELYMADHPQTEVARVTGLAQSTISRLIALVRQAQDVPEETLGPRVNRYKHPNRRQALFALFEERPPGALVPRQELLAFFADTQNPAAALCVTLKRYNRQLQDTQIVQEAGGYRLVPVQAAAA